MDVNLKVSVPAVEKLVDYGASGVGAIAGSACVVNGRLRHNGQGAVRRAPQCIVFRVGFYVLQTSAYVWNPAAVVRSLIVG